MKELVYILGIGLVAVIVIHLFSTRSTATKNVFYQLPPQETNIVMPRMRRHMPHWHRGRRRHHPHFKYTPLMNAVPGFTHMHGHGHKFPRHKMHNAAKAKGGGGFSPTVIPYIPIPVPGPRHHSHRNVK